MVSFTVNSSDDSAGDAGQGSGGAGTLRQGVNYLAANSGGTITFSGVAALPSTTPLALASGVNFGLAPTSGATISIANAFTGAGALTMAGAGTLLLTGTNSYTGSTIVNSGTLTVGSGGSLGDTFIAVAAGATFKVADTGSSGSTAATLTINGTSTTAANGLFAGTGTFTRGEIIVGTTGQAVVTQNSGDVVVSGSTSSLGIAAGSLFVGQSAGSLGTYNLNGGSLTTNNQIFIGDNGAGSFNQSGGLVNSGGKAVYLGLYSLGTYSLSGGTLTTGPVYVGYNSVGRFSQTSGFFFVNSTLYIGDGGANGYYTMSGGTLTSTRTQVSDYSNVSSFTQTGGAHITGVLSLSGVKADSSGTYTLGGGSASNARLAVMSVGSGQSGTSGTSTFHFDGGLLQARGSAQNFFQGLTTADVMAGGARIDTVDASFYVVMAQALATGVSSGVDGGLTKVGVGILGLTGTDTYTGATNVNAGVLEIGAGGSITSSIAVHDSARLRGVGSISGSVSVESGGLFAPGSGAGTGVFTIGRDLTLQSGSSFREIIGAPTSYGSANVGGQITLGGALSLTITAASLPVGSVFTLLHETGSTAVSGTFLDKAEGSAIQVGGYSVLISYAGGVSHHDVTLTVTASPPHLTIGSDLTADGRTDLIFRDTQSGSLIDWNGAQSSQVTVLGSVSTSAYESQFADFDGDGRTDIAFRSTSNGQVVIWNHGSPAAATVSGFVSTTDYEMYTPDLNGDGKSDLFFRNKANGALVVWDNGDYTKARYLGALGSEWSITTGDLEGDGKTDLVFLSSNSGAIVEWSGGDFHAGRTLGTLGQGWKIVSSSADFDGNGKSDVTFMNTSSGNVVTWTDGDYTHAVFRGSVAANTEVVTGDFNGDGFSDLLFRNPSTGVMTVWDGGNASTAHTVGTVGTQYLLFG